jgi:anti-sigma factor RsiW
MGRLDAAETTSITNHINDCPRCAEYLTEIEAMSRALRNAAIQARAALPETATIPDAFDDEQREQLNAHLDAVHERLLEVARLVRSAYGAESSQADHADQIVNVIATFHRQVRLAGK